MAPEKHPLAFCIDAVTRSFVLRASNRDELNEWVFAYHKAAVSVVQLLMDPHHIPRETRLRLAKWWKSRELNKSDSREEAKDMVVDAKVEDGGEGIAAGVAWSSGACGWCGRGSVLTFARGQVVVRQWRTLISW